MNGQFEKIKKRFLTEAIIKSVICGVSAGLFAVGAVLLGLKLAEIHINAGFYVLIGLFPALIAGGGVFLFLRPDEEKIAKSLDREYALGERIQTMVEFRHREEDIYGLQRQDADEKLAALPKYKPDFKKLWHYAVIAVLSLAIFITAVALPQKAPPAEPEIPFEYSERQKAAVEQLIADVNETSLTDDEKTSVTATLTTMSQNLESSATQSEMKAQVFSAVAIIDLLLYTTNSFDNVAYAVTGRSADEQAKMQFFAEAIKNGVLFFKASATAVTQLDQVKTLESGIVNSVGERVDMDTDVFIQQYGADVNADVHGAVTEINGVLERVSNDTVAPADDAVRLSVENFLTAMREVEENFQNYGEEELQSVIKTNIKNYKDELVPALVPQSYRCIADEFIRRRTAQIFGIDASALPSQSSGVQELDENGGNDKNDDGTHEGGIGPGDTVFGSSEFIYDPDTGELTAYGKVFNRYYASMSEQLFNGSIPENLQESIKNYFDILYSGTIEKPDEGNKED